MTEKKIITNAWFVFSELVDVIKATKVHTLLSILQTS